MHSAGTRNTGRGCHECRTHLDAMRFAVSFAVLVSFARVLAGAIAGSASADGWATTSCVPPCAARVQAHVVHRAAGADS